MKHKLLGFFLAFTPLTALAQEGDFEFGKILHSELEMKRYDKDTSAAAVVLNEFGTAFITDDYKIIFEYHVKIKILKNAGTQKGNFSIPLYKEGKVADKAESLISVQATTYNYDAGRIKETVFSNSNLFIEKSNNYLNYAKFALADVRVGSVIEVKYSTESPYLFAFHTWEYQDDIPKVRSEFWGKIPANFEYSVSMRGFLKLSKSDVVLSRGCFRASGASDRSDCSVGKYVMTDIPAFIKEDYMTAPKNFISAIYYELSQYTRADGYKDKYSEEWKDVDAKLKEHELFGAKIKKARKMMDDIVAPVVAQKPEPIDKAMAIYEFIQSRYSWDGDNGIYSDLDVKAVYEKRIGGCAEINFALIGALQSVGLNADPVLVSTRDHGLPFKLHPQRSDFNYVISSLRIGDQLYLLDATDPWLTFGVLPIRCLNDQGRLVSKDESTWVDLRPTQKYKSSVSMQLKLTNTGELKGKLTLSHHGYSAISQRKEIFEKKSDEDYIKSLSKEFGDATLTEYQAENKTDLAKPLVEKMEIELTGLDNTGANIVYFNPFLSGRYENNPFKSNERLYPVDLGAPIETAYIISIEVPENFLVDELPANMAIGLPNNGGKCLLNVAQIGNKITLSSILSLSKPIYTSEEYHSLKEFFARVVQMQQSQFVFKKK